MSEAEDKSFKENLEEAIQNSKLVFKLKSKLRSEILKLVYSEKQEENDHEAKITLYDLIICDYLSKQKYKRALSMFLSELNILDFSELKRMEFIYKDFKINIDDFESDSNTTILEQILKSYQSSKLSAMNSNKHSLNFNKGFNYQETLTTNNNLKLLPVEIESSTKKDYLSKKEAKRILQGKNEVFNSNDECEKENINFLEINEKSEKTIDENSFITEFSENIIIPEGIENVALKKLLEDNITQSKEELEYIESWKSSVVTENTFVAKIKENANNIQILDNEKSNRNNEMKNGINLFVANEKLLQESVINEILPIGVELLKTKEIENNKPISFEGTYHIESDQNTALELKQTITESLDDNSMIQIIENIDTDEKLDKTSTNISKSIENIGLEKMNISSPNEENKQILGIKKVKENTRIDEAIKNIELKENTVIDGAIKNIESKENTVIDGAIKNIKSKEGFLMDETSGNIESKEGLVMDETVENIESKDVDVIDKTGGNIESKEGFVMDDTVENIQSKEGFVMDETVENIESKEGFVMDETVENIYSKENVANLNENTITNETIKNIESKENVANLNENTLINETVANIDLKENVANLNKNTITDETVANIESKVACVIDKTIEKIESKEGFVMDDTVENIKSKENVANLNENTITDETVANIDSKENAVNLNEITVTNQKIDLDSNNNIQKSICISKIPISNSNNHSAKKKSKLTTSNSHEYENNDLKSSYEFNDITVLYEFKPNSLNESALTSDSNSPIKYSENQPIKYYVAPNNDVNLKYTNKNFESSND